MVTLAHVLANTINPIFFLLMLAAPWVWSKRPPPWRYSSLFALARTLPWRFWLVCALADTAACWLAEWGKRRPLLAGHPEFPSGHETFVLASATCLLWIDRRWLPIVLPLVLVMAWALVAAGYHHPIDVLGSWLVGPPVALLCQALFHRAPRRNTGTFPPE